MNPGKKSNKHSDLNTKVIVPRNVHTFELVEPDEVLEGYSITSYKSTIKNLLRSFNGALFMTSNSNPNLLEANTDLTIEDIKTQQDRKMRINLTSLLLAVNSEKQSHYKNLDDFKDLLVVDIRQITLQQIHWAFVNLKRHSNQPSYPYLSIELNLNEFKLEDFALCNIINPPIYSSYFTKVELELPIITFSKSITRIELGEYKDVINKFYVDLNVHKSIPEIKFYFNLSLYFSHLRYLQKVLNTYL